MGRYSSVQAYADNNANVRSISYEQATGSSTASDKKSAVTTEKVSNPYGSTAGAGSGEFHVYRHARAREAARWKELDASQEQAELEQQFQEEMEQAQTDEQLKTAKRRKKRQRERESKQRKKNLKAAGILNGQDDDNNENAAEDEFSYDPEMERKVIAKATEESLSVTDNPSEASGSADVSLSVDSIPNDGSFLDMMKKKLQADPVMGGNEDGEGPMLPPPSKKITLESRIIDEDDEGPMPLF